MEEYSKAVNNWLAPSSLLISQTPLWLIRTDRSKFQDIQSLF